jgi:tetratricopeptide (TPR) repeat protein
MATVVVYWQVHHFDFVFDDLSYIIENDHVHGGFTKENIIWTFTGGTQVSNYWHPLTWMSHILDFQLYGMNAGGHHLTNLLFHVANTILLFLVFRYMTGNLWRSGFIAALFALHPLHVESVAWVAERKDVLSTFFWLLTMASYCRYAEKPEFNKYFFVFLFFFLGLMSKPMLVTLPFVLILMDFWPLGRLQLGQESKTGSIKVQKSSVLYLVVEKIPLFALSATASVAAYITQQEGMAVPPMNLELLKIQSANAMVSYVSYIGKMIWPSRLSVYYPHPGMPPTWKIAGAVLLLIGLSAFLGWTWRKFPYLTFGWLWFLGTFVPVIGFVKIGNFAMADRYTYVPLIGLFVIIAWGIPELAPQWRHQKICIAALATVILSMLIVVTWKQLGYWKNNITLFEHSLKLTNNNIISHYNLGVALDKQGRTEEAIGQYLETLQINPNYIHAHNNLGAALEKQGRLEEAIDHYLQALRINPDFAEAHNNLGNALDKQGRTEEAIDHYLQALQINPENEKAHYNVGVALDKQGRTEEAIDHYSQALRINPKYTKVYNNLGVALRKQGRTEEAIDLYLHALHINPGFVDAYNNLGVALSHVGKTDEAIAYLQKSLQINPNYPITHVVLGGALFKKGEIRTAITHFRESLRLKPDYAIAQDNLMNAMAVLKKTDTEIADIKIELIFYPENPDLHYKLGSLYQTKGNLDAAGDEYQQALSIESEHMESLNNLALVYMMKNEIDKALPLFTKLIDLQPDNADHYYDLAFVYALKNSPDESIAWLKKAVAKGYNKWGVIKNDKNLENIRNSSYYRELIKDH